MPTASDRLAASLAAIDQHAARTNAFIRIDADGARSDAKAADDERARGVDRGPLHGMPISIKDLIDIAGQPTTAGSHVRAGHVAAADAPVIQRLRTAGAVLIGKTNVHEFALGPTSDESAFGPVLNPVDPTRIAGGSSGGSAAAVAAGMGEASIGSDTDADGGAPKPMDIGVRPAVDAVSAIGNPSSSRRPAARPDVVGQSLSNMLLGAPPAPLGETRASAPLVPPVGIGDKNQPIDLFTSGSISSHQVAEAALAVESAVLGPNSGGSPAPVPEASVPSSPAPAATVPAGSWIVQIGAAPTKDGANGLLDSAAHKVATLGDVRPYVERVDSNGQTFFRARFVGFGSRTEASGICSQLKKAKMSCLALQS